MIYNHEHADSLSFSDYFEVIWHGLPLDIATTCYILVIPVLFIIISAFVKDFKLRKILTPYYILIGVAMALAFVADCVVYDYWGTKVDATDFIYLNTPIDLLASLSVKKIFVIVVIIFAFAMTYYHGLKRRTKKSYSHTATKLLTPFFLVILGLMFLCIRGGVGNSTSNPSYVYYSNQAFLNHASLNPLFNIAYSMFKAEDYANEFQYYPEAEYKEDLGDSYFCDSTMTKHFLRNTRPDILLIVWEGCGDIFADDISVTPRLNQLKKQGIYFTNLYANSYRTDRGLVSILNGWPSFPTNSLMKKTKECSKLPSLSHSLVKYGYTSSFFYGGDKNFTNMNMYLRETGFDYVYDEENFDETAEKSGWGVRDEYLLVPEIISKSQANTAEKNRQRFLSVVLTLCSHDPWDVPTHKFQDERKNSFAYTDSCLGHFIDEIKKTPEWKHLLVIITADHGACRDASQSTSDIEVGRIPMIWLGGALNSEAGLPYKENILMNQSDLASLLLSQMKLASREFPLSRNVLSKSYKDLFAVHAYKNGLNYVDKKGISTFDCIQETEANSMFKQDYKRIHREKSYLQNLYMKTAVKVELK